jgi:hypothetical protein
MVTTAPTPVTSQSLATTARTRLRRGRAIWTFFGAYALVTVLCAALSIAIGVIQHDPSATGQSMVHNPAYVLSEKFDPLVNLAVWAGFALLYFRRTPVADRTARHARKLGLLWLCLALPVDFVGFVLIKNPISLSPHDFYVGQFPWIYLIYLAVFLGPICAALLTGRARAHR